MGRTYKAGDQVLLVDRKRRRYLVTLQPGAEFTLTPESSLTTTSSEVKMVPRSSPTGGVSSTRSVRHWPSSS